MTRADARPYTRIDTLRRIEPGHLLAFLAPYRAYLEGRGFKWPNAHPLDYTRLSRILLSPGDSTPPDLGESLHQIGAMDSKAGLELLLEAVARAGLAVDAGAPVTPIDFAVQVWLQKRELVEEMRAVLSPRQPRTVEYFITLAAPVPEFKIPPAATWQALERDLNAWFEQQRRGATGQLRAFEQDDDVWIMVRHGEPYTREPMIENNDSGSIHYQPEKHDVLVFDPRLGELRVTADTPGEREQYRRLVGLHLLGDRDSLAGRSRFDLERLRALGEDALRCADVAGMEWVKLLEVQIFRGGMHKEFESRKSADLFASLRERERSLPAGGKLTRARFLIKFAGSRAPRAFSLCSGSRAQFERDDDAAIIERWLGRRGFIVGFKDETGH